MLVSGLVLVGKLIGNAGEKCLDGFYERWQFVVTAEYLVGSEQLALVLVISVLALCHLLVQAIGEAFAYLGIREAKGVFVSSLS